MYVFLTVSVIPNKMGFFGVVVLFVFLTMETIYKALFHPILIKIVVSMFAKDYIVPKVFDII